MHTPEYRISKLKRDITRFEKLPDSPNKALALELLNEELSELVEQAAAADRRGAHEYARLKLKEMVRHDDRNRAWAAAHGDYIEPEHIRFQREHVQRLHTEAYGR
jgi:hypothetical protein